MLEHPLVTQINRRGYPLSLVERKEDKVFDFFGDEITGNEKFYDFDGDLVLLDNLDKFLTEEFGAKIKYNL